MRTGDWAAEFRDALPARQWYSRCTRIANSVCVADEVGREQLLERSEMAGLRRQETLPSGVYTRVL